MTFERTHPDMLKRILLAVLCMALVITCTHNVAAQEAAANAAGPTEEKRALIRELMEVIDVKKSVTALYNTMVEEQERNLPDIVWEAVASMPEVKRLSRADQTVLRAKLAQEAKRIGEHIRELFLKKVDLGRLLEDISIVAYDKYFSEEQLKDLITFYRSPTGKRTIEVMPALFAESMTQTMEAVRPKIGELMNDLMKEESERIRQTVVTYKPKPSSKSPTPKRSRTP
jgi:uncharacterized protein